MHAVVRDFRLAVRSLLRVPVFTAVGVLTLAIGLGTTTLMFTTANAAFLQPLPFPSEGLIRIWQVSRTNPSVNIPPQVWRDWQRLTSVSSLAASWGAGNANVSNGPDAERAVVAGVSRNFFETFGVTPVLGRGFSAEESTPNGPVAVVISSQLWERFFGRSPEVLSRLLVIEGVPHPVVGVMPGGFTYPQNADLWTTFERDPRPNLSRTSHEYEVIGRLRPGVTLASARAEVEAVTRSLHAAHAEMRDEGFGVRVADLRADLLDSSIRPVNLLMAAVGCLLLVACANVVNLLLARSVSRHAQTTLRVALGASNADILRVFVMESLALSIAGGVLGAVLMIWTSDLAAGLLPVTFRGAGTLRPDLTVFVVLALLMFAVGVVCAIAPARLASRVDLRDTLAAGAQSVAVEPRAMRIMVGVEVALGVILLAGASLFIRSLAHLEQIDPGFRRTGAVASSFSLGTAPGSPSSTPAARAEFYDRLLERSTALPGVTAAGVTSSFPFAFSPNALLEEDGVPLGQWGQAPVTNYRVIGGRYFEAMGTRLLAGRVFEDVDRAGSPLVAIVNESTVNILWNGANALGRRVRMANMDGFADYATVVGVVADMRHRGLTQPPVSEVYFPYRQRPARTYGMTLVAASDVDAGSVATALRAAVRGIDPSVPVVAAPIAARLDRQLAAPRFRTRLLAGLAATALALAAFGIFGVVTYSVAARRREMGIRLAIGARGSDVRRLVLRRALGPVVIGLAAGTTVALFASRLLSSLLFGIDRTDPASYAAAAVGLLAAAIAAAWLPAHRATRVDPLITLRAQ